ARPRTARSDGRHRRRHWHGAGRRSPADGPPPWPANGAARRSRPPGALAVGESIGPNGSRGALVGCHQPAGGQGPNATPERTRRGGADPFGSGPGGDGGAIIGGPGTSSLLQYPGRGRFGGAG